MSQTHTLGGVAQPVRALRSHGRGQGFESLHAHHKRALAYAGAFLIKFFLRNSVIEARLYSKLHMDTCPYQVLITSFLLSNCDTQH